MGGGGGGAFSYGVHCSRADVLEVYKLHVSAGSAFVLVAVIVRGPPSTFNLVARLVSDLFQATFDSVVYS